MEEVTAEVEWPMTMSLSTPPPFVFVADPNQVTDGVMGDEGLDLKSGSTPPVSIVPSEQEPPPLSSTEEDPLSWSCLFCLSPAPQPDSLLKKKLKKDRDCEKTGRLALGHRELFAYLCKKSGLEPPRVTLISRRAAYCSVCLEIHKELSEVYTEFTILKAKLQSHVDKLVVRVVKSHLEDNSFLHFTYPGHGGFQRLRFQKGGNVLKANNGKSKNGQKRGRKRKVEVAKTSAEPEAKSNTAPVENEGEATEALHFSLADVFDDYGFDFDSHCAEAEEVEGNNGNADIEEQNKKPGIKLDDPNVKKAPKHEKVETIVNKKSQPCKKDMVKNKKESKGKDLRTSIKYSLKPCTVPLVRCDLKAIKIEPVETAPPIKVEQEEPVVDEVYESESPTSPMDTFDQPCLRASDTATSPTKKPQRVELEILISNVESLNASTKSTNLHDELLTPTDRRRSLRKRKSVAPLVFEEDSDNDNEKDEDFVVEEVSKVRGRPRKHPHKNLKAELSSSSNLAKSESNKTESESESNSDTNESDEEDLMDELVDNLEKRQNRIQPKSPKSYKRKARAYVSPYSMKKGSLFCKICPNHPVFPSNYERSVHLKIAHPEELKRKCPECGKEMWLEQFAKHLRISHEKPATNKPLSCSKCDKKFAVKYFLEEHERGHEMEKELPIVCNICDMRFPIQINKAFKGEDVMKNHMRSSHGIGGRAWEGEKDKRFICVHCGKRFTRTTFNAHMVRKHPEKCTHTCPTCNQCYPTADVLKCHMILHTEGPTYACNICTVKVTSLEIMKEHFKSHYSLLRCTINPNCSKVFGSEGERTRHNVLKHGQEKKFSCDICNKKFAIEADVLTHKKRLHTSTPPIFFQCDQCPSSAPVSFRTKCQLKNHIRVVHEGVRFLCTYPNCNKELASQHCLNEHLSRHKGDRPRPFKCTWKDCKCAFETRQKIQRHVTCVHLLKKNNICDKCGKGFGELSNLKIHMTYWCKANPEVNPDHKTYRISKGKWKRIQPVFNPVRKGYKRGKTTKDPEDEDDEC